MRYLDNRRMVDLTALGAVVVGIPAVLALALLAPGGGPPKEAVTVILGAFLMGLVWFTLSLTEATVQRQSRVAKITPLESTAPLELAYSVPLVLGTPMPVAVNVVGAIGACPQGYRVGSVLNVDPSGALSAPLCRSAAQALGAACQGLGGPGDETQVSCRCPLGDRSLTFAAALSRS